MGQLQHGPFFGFFSAPTAADGCRLAPIYADLRRANYLDGGRKSEGFAHILDCPIALIS